MRPTGSLHIGHLSVLQNWVNLQDKYESFFSIVDWHALTTSYQDKTDYRQLIKEIALDWLSVGLDPNKCAIFRQSEIKEHAELHLLFSMFTPISWLERVPTYKDQIQQLGSEGKDLHTYGFLGYPLLQAADILVYKATAVPVGEDQIPHIELCREIARRFNYLYGNIFPEPQAIVGKISLLPGIDGRKMSKSYNNAILLTDSPEEIRKKVSTMITDPARIRKNDPGHPEVCTVFAFHKVFNKESVAEVESQCRKGAIGCVQCKKNLAEKMIEYLAPIYEKKQTLINKPGYVKEIIENGNKEARKIAKETMEEVRNTMKIDWLSDK